MGCTYVACLPQILVQDKGLVSALYAPGCWHAVITSVGNSPPHLHGIVQHLHISNDGTAWLGPMVWWQVWVPAGIDHVQWGRPALKEVFKQAYSTLLGALQPWTGPGLIDSKLQAMTTQSVKCQLRVFRIQRSQWTYGIHKMKKASGHRRRKKFICAVL